MSEKNNLTDPSGEGRNEGEDQANEENMVDKITARHVARCLDDLGNSVPPAVQRTIKIWFWRLADDIKQGQQGEQNDESDRFNR